MKHKNRIRLVVILSSMLILLLTVAVPVYADNLDEIQKYEITADVNDDATVKLTYHVVWKVLDDESEGPLEWVRIGIPNSHVEDVTALSDNIENIEVDEDGGTVLNIYLDDTYYADEVVTFDFSIVQGYMYQMNVNEEGTTQYTFTPGWFDEIVVDEMVIRWNMDKASSFEPSCLVRDGYYTWTTSLDEGDTYTVNVSYPNDAYNFSQEVSDNYQETESYDGDYYDDFNDDYYDDYYYSDSGMDFTFLFPVVVWLVLSGASLVGKSNRDYNKGSGFGKQTETKITRTKVVYHTNCPNCGAPREEGKDSCQFCGTSLVKSEVIIKEEELSDEEKAELGKYKKDGEYSYGMPDTYIRIHTVHIPVTTSHHGRGGGCAHSSCACACASCACACACACAGGGRAGCSNKDFYKKSLKLRQLKKK